MGPAHPTHMMQEVLRAILLLCFVLGPSSWARGAISWGHVARAFAADVQAPLQRGQAETVALIGSEVVLHTKRPQKVQEHLLRPLASTPGGCQLCPTIPPTFAVSILALGLDLWS